MKSWFIYLLTTYFKT